MLLIPLTTGVVYPFFKRLGWELTPLRDALGIALGAPPSSRRHLNMPVAAGDRISILWQIVPYVVLTVGEILVWSRPRVAYTQAPLTMKSVIRASGT